MTRKPLATRPAPDAKEIILLAVTGMSPAILTETVWALAHEKPAVIPNRVVVITTRAGRNTIARDLLEPNADFDGKCPWDSLMATLQTKKIKVAGRLQFGATASDLKVITARDPVTGRSHDLEDIRTREENEAAADFILETLRTFTENPDNQVIASIAGGRKTMGALLTTCMSLIGREDDRLTHVLVDEPFDDPRFRPRFYFPGQPARELTGPDRTIADASKAGISLAEVPFVPLRNLFQKELRRMPGSFGGLVARCRSSVAHLATESLALVIQQDVCRAKVNDLEVKTTPREHLFLLFFASQPSVPLGEVYVDLEDPLNAFREQVVQSGPEDSFSDWRCHDTLTLVIRESDETVRKVISSLRSKFKAISPAGAQVAKALPERGRLSFDLPGSCIRIE